MRHPWGVVHKAKVIFKKSSMKVSNNNFKHLMQTKREKHWKKFLSYLLRKVANNFLFLFQYLSVTGYDIIVLVFIQHNHGLEFVPYCYMWQHFCDIYCTILPQILHWFPLQFLPSFFILCIINLHFDLQSFLW